MRIFQSPFILTIQVKLIPLTVSVITSHEFPLHAIVGVVSLVKYGVMVSFPILTIDRATGEEVLIVKEGTARVLLRVPKELVTRTVQLE
jgi:hypothetical protein